MINKKVLAGMAQQIFNMQNRGGGVPSSVLAACRAAKQMTATPAQADLILNFRGVRQTGAAKLRADSSAASAFLGKVGTYSNLIGTISQGGAPAVGAGLGLANAATADIENFFKNKNVQRGVENVLAEGLKGRGVVSSLLQRALNAAVTEKTLKAAYGMVSAAQGAAALGTGAAGAARYMGALARGAGTIGAFAAAGTTLGIGGGSLITGNVNIERRRLLNQETALSLADSTLSGPRRRLAGLNFLSADNRLHGWGAAPYVGEHFAARADRASGFSARSKGLLETGADIQEERLGGLNAQQLRAQSAGRYYRGKSLTTTGARLEQWWDETGRSAAGGVLFPGGNEESEKGITAQSKQTLTKARALSDRFSELSRQRRFRLAREVQRQANIELPGTLPNGMTPEISYKQQVTTAVADRMWVISMSPRAGTREFEH